MSACIALAIACGSAQSPEAQTADGRYSGSRNHQSAARVDHAENESRRFEDMEAEEDHAVASAPASAKQRIVGSETEAIMQEPSAIGASERVYNTESYDSIVENRFLSTGTKPLSTFSIDVDTVRIATCAGS